MPDYMNIYKGLQCLSVRFTYIFSIIFLLVFKAQANESHVATLYQQFLTGTNSTGFIVFEREITFPPRRAKFSAPTSVGSNSVQQLNIPNKNYFSFCWADSNFIITSSSDAPLTNENDVASASRLYGYDGQSYWRLLNDASQTYINSKEGPGFLPPVDSASILTVIPKDEALSSRDKYVPNATLSTINELAAECRRVVQLGFSYPIQGKPSMVSSTVIIVNGVGGRTQTMHITGSMDHPEILNYDATTNAMAKFRVSIDYSTDTLIIDRLSASGRKPITTIHYKILSVRMPAPSQEKSMFSWQTYKANDGKVIAELAKSGATVSADFTKDGNLQPGKMLTPAKPLPGRAPNRIFIYLFFVVSTIGLLVFIFFILRQQIKRNPNKNIPL